MGGGPTGPRLSQFIQLVEFAEEATRAQGETAAAAMVAEAKVAGGKARGRVRKPAA